MILKIPMLGWLSTKPIVCGKCKKEIGYYVFGLATENNVAFHSDCHTDIVAEREGWTEYREKYKEVNRKYGL